MRVIPHDLERWLSANPCKYDLASGGITKLKLGDLGIEIDYDMVMSYGPTNGSEVIRQRVADMFSNVDKDNVLITSGAAEANFLVLYALLEKRDEFVTQLPTYMHAVSMAQSLGAKIKAYFLLESMNYKPDLESLNELVSKRTKIIFITNPNNPTGSIVSSKELQSICEIAEDVGAYVLCDGALRGLEIEGNPAPSPVKIYDKGIATGSLSKVGLAGLRIGWLVADKNLIKRCWALKDYTTLCHSGIGEYLATIALQRENMNRYFERAKNVIRSHLNILSNWVVENSEIISCVPPKAGHTAFIKYACEIDSLEFCKRLFKEEEVLLSPGKFFGSDDKHLRVRYSCEKEILVEGLKKLNAFLNRIKQT